MKIAAVAAALAVAASSSAIAQTTTAPGTSQPPASQQPGNSAINSSGTTKPGAPVAGANSFTEAQAKSRIEAQGYANVSALKKDDSGVWRGTAMKNGSSKSVSLDFQGNVNAQ